METGGRAGRFKGARFRKRGTEGGGGGREEGRGRKETEKGKVEGGGEGKERKEEIIFDRMFRRGGSEFRIGGGARGARIVSWRGWVR